MHSNKLNIMKGQQPAIIHHINLLFHKDLGVKG